MSYAVRITRPSCDISGMYVKLDAVCQAVVIYEHPDPSNVHVHMLLLDCTVGTDTLKNYVRKEIGFVDKKDWSFKAKADKNFIAYMSKGKYDPVHVYGINADEIAIYKSQGYDKKALRVEDGKFVKPIKEVVKRTKRELVELMVSSIDLDGEVSDIARGVKKVLSKHNEVIGNYKVLDFIDACMMYGNEERWVNNITSMYERRYAR